MKIIHVTAEIAPVAKVGGLGDVVHGLSRELLQQGHEVTVILPKYDTLQSADMKLLSSNLTASFAGKQIPYSLWTGLVDTIPVIFIESEDFFNRGAVYGSPDDIDRFNFFCLCALAYLRNNPPNVIHLHDWHTAVLAGLLKENMNIPTVLTIHNLSYQGWCNDADLNRLGWKHPALKENGNYNLLKGGIILADAVTTVSPNYAREILTPEYGCNLQKSLVTHQNKLFGILNGIDYDFWNPATDPFIPHHYSAQDLSGKKKMKEALRKRFSLVEEDCPIVCSVSRLVYQKGPELIKAAIIKTLEWGGQFVLIGSSSDEQSQNRFHNLKQKLEGSPHIHLEVSFDEELAHLTYAGSDLLLIPSLFEPCGLTQMIGMRYGTLPLVRACGGLVDTVFEEKNGFLFGPPTAEALHQALEVALDTWYQQPDAWRKMMQTGMQTDFSWSHPAQEYIKVYKHIAFS